jgi:hypothetical protein
MHSGGYKSILTEDHFERFCDDVLVVNDEDSGLRFFREGNLPARLPLI